VTRVKPDLGPGIRQRVQWAADLDPALVGPARKRREEIAGHMERLLAGGAVLVLPTVPGIAPIRNAAPADTEDFRARALALLCPAGLARLPQVSLSHWRKNSIEPPSRQRAFNCSTKSRC
jgi:amidase